MGGVVVEKNDRRNNNIKVQLKQVFLQEDSSFTGRQIQLWNSDNDRVSLGHRTPRPKEFPTSFISSPISSFARSIQTAALANLRSSLNNHQLPMISIDGPF